MKRDTTAPSTVYPVIYFFSVTSSLIACGDLGGDHISASLSHSTFPVHTLTPGHEIVATIAQIHLHPEVRDKLCDILPKEAKCHMAPVAAWADTIRSGYPGTAPMHYVNRECRRADGVLARTGGAPLTSRDPLFFQPSLLTRPILTAAKLDHPGDTCTFGEHGWINEDVNVLTAIMNKTEEVRNGGG